jgi:hypothetical protein
MRPPTTGRPKLAANAELEQKRLIAFRSRVPEIPEHPAPLGDHGQKTLSRGMILLVGLKMSRKLRDALTQQGYLDFRRSCISLTTLISGNYLSLYVGRQCHARVVAPCLLFISF